MRRDLLSRGFLITVRVLFRTTKRIDSLKVTLFKIGFEFARALTMLHYLPRLHNLE